eukprot:4055500-Pleurochrysis_carterae.AAC.4
MPIVQLHHGWLGGVVKREVDRLAPRPFGVERDAQRHSGDGAAGRGRGAARRLRVDEDGGADRLVAKAAAQLGRRREVGA